MNKKFLGWVAGIVVLALVGSVVVAGRMINKTGGVEEGVKAVVEEKNFAWGKIGINDGVVEKEFTIKNAGTEELRLFNVVTSCMCTKAEFTSGTSPVFGMHTQSDYIETVEPGGETQLKVTFDPAFHGPNGVGPITRQIELVTNDPKMPRIEFVVTAMVVR